MDLRSPSLQLQACLKEIHAKMLHKHLQYLEPRLESEDNLEAEPSSEPKVEDDGIQDLLQGIRLLSFVSKGKLPFEIIVPRRVI